MRTMKKNNVGDAAGLYYDIIEAWFQLREPSLEELAEALERSDYRRIARKLRGEIEPFDVNLSMVRIQLQNVDSLYLDTTKKPATTRNHDENSSSEST